MTESLHLIDKTSTPCAVASMCDLKVELSMTLFHHRDTENTEVAQRKAASGWYESAYQSSNARGDRCINRSA